MQYQKQQFENLMSIQTQCKNFSCNSCQRLTVIEGESICARHGRAISLKPTLFHTHISARLFCQNWVKK